MIVASDGAAPVNGSLVRGDGDLATSLALLGVVHVVVPEEIRVVKERLHPPAPAHLYMQRVGVKFGSAGPEKSEI